MSAKRTIEDMRALAATRGGACLSVEYKNAHTKLLWECGSHHQWWAKPNTVASTGSWCPVCDRSSTSVGERISREVLEIIFGVPFPKAHPRWLAAGRARGLQLDGYAEASGIAFEYHGHQHYQPVLRFGGEKGFAALRVRDAKKAKLCADNGVRLIAIPHFTDINNLPGCIDQIEHAVLWAGLALPKRWKRPTGLPQVRDPLTRLFGTSGLSELRRIAEEKGGALLSCDAASANDYIRWSCAKRHEWEAPAYRIRAGHWCAHCSGNKRTVADMHRFAAELRGEFLSPEYQGAQKKHQWRCGSGHEFSARPDMVAQGHWCPHCANTRKKSLKKTLADLAALAAARQGRVVSTAYFGSKAKHEWECAAGHRFHTAPTDVAKGNWCRACYEARRGTRRPDQGVQTA